MLFYSYGVSWFITMVAMGIAYAIVKKRFLRREGVLA